jgi:hypothetical protein
MKNAQLHTALKLKRGSQDPGPFPKEYRGEDISFILREPNFWQKFIMKRVQQEPHKRKIIWIFDWRGNSGKTTLAKILFFERNVLYFSADHEKDIFFARMNNKDTNVIICDLPRTLPSSYERNDIFSALEQIKNGIFFNKKWNSATVVTTIPHVIVFANYLPEYKSLTYDRWEFLRLCCQGSEFVPMDQSQHNSFLQDRIYFDIQLQRYNELKYKDERGAKLTQHEIQFLENASDRVKNNRYEPSETLIRKYGDSAIQWVLNNYKDTQTNKIQDEIHSHICELYNFDINEFKRMLEAFLKYKKKNQDTS